MRTGFYFFMLIGCIMIAGCAHEQKKPADLVNAAKAPVIMDPFRYHKLLEVAPGQYYDILSWGRGAADTGSFLILHSDSSGKKYTTTTGDFTGKIIDVYNADMDTDGNPEILIVTKTKDTINYTNIYAFEFYNNSVQKLEFPKLSASKTNYRGNDNFYIQEGKLIREFPSYTGTGKNAKLTGGKYKFEYGLSDNAFTVKTLVKDSTQVDKIAVEETAKSQPQEKTTKTTKAKKSEKKHHKVEAPKKKHKKRRHNDD